MQRPSFPRSIKPREETTTKGNAGSGEKRMVCHTLLRCVKSDGKAAKFSHNAHIVQPGRKDYLPPHGPQIRATFPEPFPVYLARNSKLPAAALPVRDHSGLQLNQLPSNGRERAQANNVLVCPPHSTRSWSHCNILDSSAPRHVKSAKNVALSSE